MPDRRKTESEDRAPVPLVDRLDLAPLLHDYIERISRRDRLGLAERLDIVDQAIDLLSQTYVHLPQKQAMHAINPVQRLRLLRDRLQQHGEQEMQSASTAKRLALPPAFEFHAEMLDIFASLRDRHTIYALPAPYNRQVAWLPLLIEQCRDGGQDQFIVTSIIGQPERVQPGDEVVAWNGVPIRRAIELNGLQQPAGNRDAVFAQGLQSLTLRPLQRMLPPNERYVTAELVDGRSGDPYTVRLAWKVVRLPESSLRSLAIARPRDQFALGQDIQGALLQQVRYEYVRGARQSVRAALLKSRRGPSPLQVKRDVDIPPPYEKMGVMRAEIVAAGGADYGYLRLFTFKVDSGEDFVDAVADTLSRLPANGLILDVRGNPGGLIEAAERLLQLFTPRRIEPTRAQFLNSPVTLKLCSLYRDGRNPFDLNLGAWLPSIQQSIRTGAIYSSALPITEAACNEIGQLYYGPVVLITDALSYSATDLLAAGFKDHRIGRIMGVTGAAGGSGVTGGGGANVWSHRLLATLLPDDAFRPLPRNAEMRVAIRRILRAADQAGTLIEDFGVEPDVTYTMSRRDVLENNDDLKLAAVKLIGEMAARAPSASIAIAGAAWSGDRLVVTLQTEQVDRVDLFLNGRPAGSVDVAGSPTVAPLEPKVKQPFLLVAQAYATGRGLVASARRFV